MPMSCCILGCTSRFSRETDIKFFHFPLKDAHQLTAWLSAIKRPNWNPSKYDRICNKHFTANDYLHRPDAHYTHLKRTAIPSIFPSIKSNERNECKIMKKDNENEKDEVDNVEKNSNSFSTTDQDIDNSYINIELIENNENIENVHTIMEESDTDNEDRNLETYDSSECLECAELDCIKNLLSSTEINLRHKIHILQQQLSKKEAKVTYLRRILTNLKQKHFLSDIQQL